MKAPLSNRKGIPFFYDKSEEEFRKDVYEQYYPMVIRQSALHLIDDLWEEYPMKAILDFGHANLPDRPIESILEIGCSVGRWIGDLAVQNPSAQCWGIDYSYQMLKQASNIWIEGGESVLNLAKYGFEHSYTIKGRSLTNLSFGLAKGEELPFDDNSQDLVLSSFLIDRYDDPVQGLKEKYRILKKSGRMMFITPLNFLQPSQWTQFHPPIKLHHILIKMGFEIVDWQEDMVIDLPLDIRGNAMKWKCIAVACDKL